MSCLNLTREASFCYRWDLTQRPQLYDKKRDGELGVLSLKLDIFIKPLLLPKSMLKRKQKYKTQESG